MHNDGRNLLAAVPKRSAIFFARRFSTAPGAKTGLVPGGATKDGRARNSTPKLTPAQKAEAATLWRAGNVTLEDLAKRFNKRPETFSRLFKEMGIVKGEAAKEHQARVTASVETRMMQDAEAMANRIAKMKEDSFRRSEGIAKLVWNEIVKAQQAGKGFESIRGSLQALNLAAATLGKVREEQYILLEVEKHDASQGEDDLPDLTVRELSQGEIDQLVGAPAPNDDELGFDDDDVVELPETLPGAQRGQGGA